MSQNFGRLYYEVSSQLRSLNDVVRFYDLVGAEPHVRYAGYISPSDVLKPRLPPPPPAQRLGRSGQRTALPCVWGAVSWFRPAQMEVVNRDTL